MGNLVTSMIDRLRGEAKSRRQQAAETLWTILLRSDEPRPGDDAKLQEAAATLGIDVDDLPRVLKVVTELDTNLKLLATEDDLRAQDMQARRAIAELDQWREEELQRVEAEYQQKRHPHNLQRGQALGGLQPIGEAKRVKNILQSRWDAIVEGVSEDEAYQRYLPRREKPYGST